MSVSRTDAKIRYAEVMLKDLRDRPGGEGDDFQRSREEAFLYHLHGTIDGFLHEVNEHYGFLLKSHNVSLSKLEEALKKKCVTNQQLDKISSLQNDPSALLARISEWRHISTHRGGTSRTFHVGGPEDGQRRINDSVTGQPTSKRILDEFADALAEMRNLIDQLRAEMTATSS